MDHAGAEGWALAFKAFLRPNGFMQNLVNYNAATIGSQNAFYGCQGAGAVSVLDIRDIAAVAVIVSPRPDTKANPMH